MYTPLKIDDLNGTYRTVLASAEGIQLVACFYICAEAQSSPCTPLYGTHFVITDSDFRRTDKRVDYLVTDDLASAIRHYNEELEKYI